MKPQKDWVTTTSQAHSRGERDRIVRKIMWRLLPFLFAAYAFCYIDRVNVGFAALTMNKDLGLTASEFGFGAGLFFIGYFIFEVPSNLLMQRFGPRVWIARIMISWGVISAFCAFVQGPVSYGIARFLLGLAEAGFTPGILLLFTLWFPGEARNRATAIFMASVPVANIIGSLLSGTLLSVGGFAGLKDWQALLVLEALPAVILGIICLLVLVDRPQHARWLTADERLLIENELRLERQALAARHGDKLRGALSDWKVYVLAGIYFCYICGSVGIGLWLPQIVHGFGLKAAAVGVVAAVPYACGAVGMVIWSSLAGSGPRRIGFAVGAMLVAAITLTASAVIEYPLSKMIGITLTVTFMLGFQAIFLSLPSGFLTGRAAAGGLAVIISIGNLGGFAGPYLIGSVKQASGSFTTALLLVAFALLIAAVGTWLLGDPADRINGKRSTSTKTVKV